MADNGGKRARAWIPNPEGKGLPHPKKWRGKSTTIRVPVEQKDLLLGLAKAIDQGDLTMEQVAALLPGEYLRQKESSPAAETTADEEDRRVTLARAILDTPPTLGSILDDAISLVDLVLSAPQSQEEEAVAKELKQLEDAIINSSRHLAGMVLGDNIAPEAD